MNGNRSRYTQTPTFGMQKRGGLLNNSSLFQKTEQKAPDFTKAPPQAEIPDPAYFASTVQSPFYGESVMPPASYMMQPTPPVQGYAPVSPLPQTGFAPQAVPSPYGMESPVASMPIGGVPLPDPSMPIASAQSSYSGNLPPLSANTPNMNGGFSARNQGFVPPQTLQAEPAPAVSAAPVMSAPPEVQPAAFSSMSGTAPFQPVGMQVNQPAAQPAYQPPQNAFYPQQAPAQAAQPFAQQPPMNGGTSSFMQMAAQNRSGQAHPGSAPANANMLWMLFLFGLIPLLFIPCLFVSQTMNILRYIFIGACLIGLGVMWYRQMLSPAVRIVVSVIYVGLCILTLSMAMENKAEIPLGTAPATTPPLQTETTPQPSDYDYAAAAGLSDPVEEPTPTPPVKSEAESRLELFMNHWCGNRVEDMVDLVQPSWASTQDSAVTSLFNLLTNRLPLSYQLEDITGTDDDTSRTITMTAEIDKQNGKEPVIYRFTVLMVKEGGQWYVNPNSLATNDEVKDTEEVVVNDKTSNVSTTEAPRTTVSPAPPGETTLYYNPDGGHYYHMDAYCASIREEYRPLTGSFLYRDLRDYSGLSPCLMCGAPTTALPQE